MMHNRMHAIKTDLTDTGFEGVNSMKQGDGRVQG
jgi:hypothetical protein